MIDGLSYVSDFISNAEENQLISIIDSLPWSNDLKRRTQHYGYKYDYTKKKVDSSLFLGQLPDWLNPYLSKLIDQKLFTEAPDQVIVNEYTPGQGISPHIDCVPCFGDTIASLSLGSACAMELKHSQTFKSGQIMLAPCSLLVFSGEARYKWLHSIPARKEDSFNNETFVRERRLSLTFRNVKKEL